jgi:hypothetical protein
METESMSYDRIWIERRDHPGGWLERSQAEKLGVNKEFDMTFNRLHQQGNFIVLGADKNFLFVELFMFETGADAQDFYDSGFMKWESFLEGEEEGCGFQEVSIYRDGHLVVSKSWAPTKPIEVNHE